MYEGAFVGTKKPTLCTHCWYNTIPGINSTNNTNSKEFLNNYQLFSLKSPGIDSMGIPVPLLMSCFRNCLEHGVFPRFIGTRGPHRLFSPPSWREVASREDW